MALVLSSLLIRATKFGLLGPNRIQANRWKLRDKDNQDYNPFWMKLHYYFLYNL
jgi:hypothetical protein